jgi:hypothetical protein
MSLLTGETGDFPAHDKSLMFSDMEGVHRGNFRWRWIIAAEERLKQSAIAHHSSADPCVLPLNKSLVVLLSARERVVSNSREWHHSATRLFMTALLLSKSD